MVLPRSVPAHVSAFDRPYVVQVGGVADLGRNWRASTRVLTYGGWRALHGQTQVGVLAAFLLYLRRFFEPMQEISQFYNTLQSAGAALEKLSGVLEEQPDVAEPRRPRELPRASGASPGASGTHCSDSS